MLFLIVSIFLAKCILKERKFVSRYMNNQNELWVSINIFPSNSIDNVLSTKA
jgi:hypothetical protein